MAGNDGEAFGELELSGFMAGLRAANMIVLSEAFADVDTVIETFERAEAVGWVLDPTLWRDKVDDRATIIKVLRAFAAYRSAVVEAHGKVFEEVPSG